MFKKSIMIFAILALAVASAKTYTVTLFEPSVLSGKELKAGEYKVDVQGSTVILTNGRQSVEATVKVENGDSKFNSTTVRYTNQSGKNAIQEIRLGGTKTKLVVN